MDRTLKPLLVLAARESEKHFSTSRYRTLLTSRAYFLLSEKMGVEI